MKDKIKKIKELRNSRNKYQINYSDYLCAKIDKSISYAEYVAESIDKLKLVFTRYHLFF